MFDCSNSRPLKYVVFFYTKDRKICQNVELLPYFLLGGAAVSALFTWLLVGKYDNKITVAADGDGIKLGFRMQF